MHFLIDGNNLAFSLLPHKHKEDIKAINNFLIDYVNKFCAGDHSYHLIFDSKKVQSGHTRPYSPHSGSQLNMRWEYVPDADSVIETLLAKGRLPANNVMVSSDRRLQRAATSAGIRWAKSENFNSLALRSNVLARSIEVGLSVCQMWKKEREGVLAI